MPSFPPIQPPDIKISPDTVLLVSKVTPPHEAASSVFHAIADQGIYVPMRAVGPAAVNQMVKASIIANGWLIVRGINILWRGSFYDIYSDRKDKDITSIVMTPVRVD